VTVSSLTAFPPVVGGDYRVWGGRGRGVSTVDSFAYALDFKELRMAGPALPGFPDPVRFMK